MKLNFTYIRHVLLCLGFMSLSWATMAQNDWITVNPDLNLPYDPNGDSKAYTTVAAMTTGPHNTPYALAVTHMRGDVPDDDGNISDVNQWYIVKYSSGGWVKIGNNIPLPGIEPFTAGATNCRIRVAPDGTAYVLRNKPDRSAVFRLPAGATDWQTLGEFEGNYFYAGASFALDSEGIAYIGIQAPNNPASLLFQKYVGNAWVAINGPIENPLQPSVPNGYNLFANPTDMVVADDGTIYTITVAFDDSYSLSAVELQSLSPSGEWHSHGMLPDLMISTFNHRTLLSLNQATGWVYIYGRYDDVNKFFAVTFDGNTMTSAEYEVASSASAWYADGNGTAYLVHETDELVHLEKFDGTEWNETGTTFSSGNGLVADAFTGNANYLYLAFRKEGDESPATVGKLLIGNIPQQTITFDAIPDKTLGDAPFVISATTDSGLELTFVSGNDKATVSGTQVILAKAGRATINANQAGDDVWAPASVQRSFCIKPAKPTVELSLADPSAPVLKSSASSNVWYLNNEIITNQTGATLTVKAQGIYTVSAKADDCVSDRSDEVNLVVTGIEKENTNVTAFPNPTEDYIDIKGLHPGCKISDIMDITGRNCAATIEETTDGYRLDVRHLKAGIYVIRINDQRQISQIKFVKK